MDRNNLAQNENSLLKDMLEKQIKLIFKHTFESEITIDELCNLSNALSKLIETYWVIQKSPIRNFPINLEDLKKLP